MCRCTRYPKQLTYMYISPALISATGIVEMLLAMRNVEWNGLVEWTKDNWSYSLSAVRIIKGDM